LFAQLPKGAIGDAGHGRDEQIVAKREAGELHGGGIGNSVAERAILPESGRNLL
jgi:hypothetical protein